MFVGRYIRSDRWSEWCKRCVNFCCCDCGMISAKVRYGVGGGIPGGGRSMTDTPGGGSAGGRKIENPSETVHQSLSFIQQKYQ